MTASMRLCLVSFLALFVELTLIRWIPSALHIVGFFNNLVLIGCFLGLGVGMARPGAVRTSLAQAATRLAMLVGVLLVLGLLDPKILIPETSDYGLNELHLGSDSAWRALLRAPLQVVLLGVFAAVTWAMIPIGRAVGQAFDELPRLTAYSWNIGGSLAGVLGFALMSWLGLPPVAWFAVILAALLPFTGCSSLALPASLIAICMGGQHWHNSHGFSRPVFWSPYYKVIAKPLYPNDWSGGFTLDVNDQFLLSGFDLRPDAKLDPSRVDESIVSTVDKLKSYYNFPFRLKPAKRVLILGSGAGNDVAAALRNGAEQITAVEIDPLVYHLGHAHHPEQPYSSSKVRVVLNDARAFLNSTTEEFDLILFATLDAHGLIANVGNVRLDSFVYTRDSLLAAQRRLSAEGLLVLSFGPFREETQYRQYATVRSVFRQEPQYYLHDNDHRTLVAGAVDRITMTTLPEQWREITRAEREAKLQEYPSAVIPATDDWPHIYLKERRIPSEYWAVLAGMVAFAVVLVRQNFGPMASFDSRFFFLGAGFLLMETKGVTEFALLIGSTWQTNVLVFSVILLMILLANLLVAAMGRRVPVSVCYLGLIGTLIASYVYPPTTWSGSAGMVGGAVYLGVPVFLAAMIFASSFRLVAVASTAIAVNLLGSVLGGVSEYLSLASGIRFLSLLAAGMYTLAWVCHWRTPTTPTTPSTDEDGLAPA